MHSNTHAHVYTFTHKHSHTHTPQQFAVDPGQTELLPHLPGNFDIGQLGNSHSSEATAIHQSM